jgi:hypothetical protein
VSTYLKSIGRDNAIALAKTEWWVGKPAKEVAKIGLFTKELCLPFDVLHKAVQEALGRPVFTHEFGLNFDGICQELLGERDAPTLEEIINLIPEEKRIIIQI